MKILHSEIWGSERQGNFSLEQYFAMCRCDPWRQRPGLVFHTNADRQELIGKIIRLSLEACWNNIQTVLFLTPYQQISKRSQLGTLNPIQHYTGITLQDRSQRQKEPSAFYTGPETRHRLTSHEGGAASFCKQRGDPEHAHTQPDWAHRGTSNLFLVLKGPYGYQSSYFCGGWVQVCPESVSHTTDSDLSH